MVSAESPENSIYLLTYRGSWNDFPKLFLPEESSVTEGELNESGICTKPSHLLILVSSDLQTQQHNLLHYLLWIIHLLLTYVFPRKNDVFGRQSAAHKSVIQPYISYLFPTQIFQTQWCCSPLRAISHLKHHNQAVITWKWFSKLNPVLLEAKI